MNNLLRKQWSRPAPSRRTSAYEWLSSASRNLCLDANTPSSLKLCEEELCSSVHNHHEPMHQPPCSSFYLLMSEHTYRKAVCVAELQFWKRRKPGCCWRQGTSARSLTRYFLMRESYWKPSHTASVHALFIRARGGTSKVRFTTTSWPALRRIYEFSCPRELWAKRIRP